MMRIGPIPRRIALVAGLVAAGALAGGPQSAVRAADVKVTQGPANEKAMFSPLFLEMPLEVNLETSKGLWVEVDDFDAWTCDFVHLRRISTRIIPHKDQVDLEIRVFTFTEASRDKAVRLAFHLIHDDELIGEAQIKHIEAEEKKNGYGTVTMSIPKVAWPTVASLVMKIDFYVTND